MITLKPGDIFAENYRLVRFIATGGFAEVWEAIFLTAGNTVALKIFPKLDEQGVKNIEEEYKNQSELLHTRLLVARYFGKYDGHPFLEMRYCSGGNAADKIGECSESEIAKCLFHIASALAYLHDDDIIHQDIKPNNFLLDANGNYFLADLGLSLKVRNTIKKFTQSKVASTSIATGLTPPPYRAPELYDRKQLNQSPIKASDIWALGSSLFELATGDVPFGEFGGMMQINDPSPPDLPEKFSNDLNELIKRCLSKNTWDRPLAQDLVEWSQHYLKNGTWDFPEKPNIISAEIADVKRTIIENNIKQGFVDPEHIQETHLDKIYNDRAIYAGTFIGGPLITGYLMAQNFKAFNQSNLIGKTWFFSVLTTLIIILSACLIPDAKKIPNYVIPLAYSSVAMVVVQRIQGRKIKEHIASGGKLHNGWRTFGIGIIGTLTTVILIIAVSYLSMPYQYGNEKKFNNTQVFFTTDITPAEVDSLGSYLVSSGFANGEEKSVQLAKSNRTYEFRMVVKKGLENDSSYEALFKSFAREISDKVFKGNNVELHACDDELNTLKVFAMSNKRKDYGTKIELGNIQMFYTSDIEEQEARSLLKYLYNNGFDNGNPKTVQIMKSGTTYQFKMVVKQAIINDDEYNKVLKTLASDLSKNVLNGNNVEVHACDEEMETLKVFTLNKTIAENLDTDADGVPDELDKESDNHKETKVDKDGMSVTPEPSPLKSENFDKRDGNNSNSTLSWLTYNVETKPKQGDCASFAIENIGKAKNKLIILIRVTLNNLDCKVKFYSPHDEHAYFIQSGSEKYYMSDLSTIAQTNDNTLIKMATFNVLPTSLKCFDLIDGNGLAQRIRNGYQPQSFYNVCIK